MNNQTTPEPLDLSTSSKKRQLEPQSAMEVEELIASLGSFKLSSLEDIRHKNASQREAILNVMEDTRVRPS